MLKTLLLLRLRSLLSVLTGASRTKKKQSGLRLALFAVLMLSSFGSLGFLFWHIFDVVAVPFSRFGFGWAYFSFAALLAFAIMLIGSVFTAKYQLFEARDNELLLSLPIHPLDILLSRLFLLWLIAALLGLPVAIPCLICWPKPLTGLGLTAFLLLFLLLLPCLCLTISSLLGWIIHRISARFGHKPAVTVLLWMAFLGAYTYLSFRMNDYLSRLAENPLGLIKMLRHLGPLAWPGQAVASGDAVVLGKLAVVILPLFALLIWLLSATFIRTATEKRSLAKKRYVERTARIQSPGTALLRRELQRLWATPAYLFNSGLGVVMALLGAVVLLIKAQTIRSLLLQEEYAFLPSLLQPLAVTALCFLSAMIFLTGPSISLEGRTLWILKSLPVSARDLLRSKLRLQLCIAVAPVLLLSAAAAFVLRTRGALLFFTLTLPVLYCVLTGLIGLAMNLLHPNFDWLNETQAVKSGASVLLTMFIGIAAAAAPVLVFAVLGEHLSVEWIGWGTLVLVSGVCLWLYGWLMRRGVRIMEGL